MFWQPGCKTALKPEPTSAYSLNTAVEFAQCLLQEKDTKYSWDDTPRNGFILKLGSRMLFSAKTRLPLKGQTAITAFANTREARYHDPLPNHDHAHIFFRSSALQSPAVLSPVTLSSTLFPPVSKLTLISGPPLCSARLGWLQCFTVSAAWPPRQASVSANKNIIAKSLQLPISAGEPLLLHWHACQGTLN